MKHSKLAALTLASVLGVSIFTGTLPANNKETSLIAEAATASVIKKVKNPDSYTYTESQKYFVKEINKIRKGMGLPELHLDPYLAQAAENHFQYMYNTGINEHEQTKGSTNRKKFFSGTSDEDRIEYVGFTDELHESDKYYSYQFGGELLGLAGQGKSMKRSAGIYEHTAVGHFASLIHPATNAFGVNKDIKKGSVVNLFANGDFYLDEDAYDYRDVPSYYYPYNGQKDVEPGYKDNEYGNPVQSLVGTSNSGKPIVYFFPKYVDKDLEEPAEISKVSVHLYDSKGNEVLVKHSWDAYEDSNSDDMTIVPYQLLLFGEKYTVKVDVQFENGKKHSDKWSFTTAGKQVGIGQLQMKNGKQAPIYDTAGKKVGVATSEKTRNIIDKKNGRFYLTKNTYVKITKDTVRITGNLGSDKKNAVPVYNSKGKKNGYLKQHATNTVYKKSMTRLYLAGGKYVNVKDIAKDGWYNDFYNGEWTGTSYYTFNKNF